MIKKILISFLLLVCLTCVVPAEEPTLVRPFNEAVRFDDTTSSTVLYFGWATVGAATSDAQWKIARMTLTGDDWVLEWESGDLEYDAIWNNRVSLSYS